MRIVSQRLFIGFILVLLSSTALLAQGDGVGGNLYAVALLIIVGAVILVSAVLTLSENFLQIETAKVGLQDQPKRGGIRSLWAAPAPKYVGEHHFIELTKGHDILLNGFPQSTTLLPSPAQRYAARPIDFRGLAPIPRVTVAVGDTVKAGEVLFHDKKDPKIKYVSPVSGEIVDIRRGEKRAINDVIILADKEITHVQHEPPSITESSREDLIDYLCETGGWTLLNQRPYDMLPDPDVVPKNIFVSTFDSAPLAPDYATIIDGFEQSFQKGLDTLARLTDGDVHLGLDARGEAPHTAFADAEGVKKHYFKGKHPSGNVGVQIHHIAPINAGEVVWTLSVQEVITLGELMFKGIWNARRVIGVTGAQVKTPTFYEAYIGANVGEMIADNLEETKSRIIDGDVLSGVETGPEDFLAHRSDQITAIEEGDYYEMFGWLLPIAPRPTISKTFPNFLYKNMKFDGDTNTHGEKRAFVVSGEYEKVLPMNLYPQHLIKAIMTGDFEKMEGYGIYELSEEDIALCEFSCTSKQPLQAILRDGLEMMREQG